MKRFLTAVIGLVLGFLVGLVIVVAPRYRVVSVETLRKHAKPLPKAIVDDCSQPAEGNFDWCRAELSEWAKANPDSIEDGVLPMSWSQWDECVPAKTSAEESFVRNLWSGPNPYPCPAGQVLDSEDAKLTR